MTSLPNEIPIDVISIRENEVAQYNEAIKMFNAIRQSLPSEWPDHLVSFKTRTDRHQAIAEIEDLDDVALVSDLWAHDDAKAAIRSNMVERAKAQSILEVTRSMQQS